MDSTSSATASQSRSAFWRAYSPRQRLLILAICLLAIAARLLPGERTIDDSYITYRYARNLLAGAGFVYNSGERVLGTTTPLYTALMTGLAFLTGGVQAPFPRLAMVVNALADAVTCFLLAGLGRHSGLKFAGWGAALVWALAPFSVTFAIGGLETSVYVLLLTALVTAYLVGRPILAAFLGALLYLTRPDALILIGPLALDYLIQRWRAADFRSSWRQVSLASVAFGGPVLLWTIFATWYFGSPLPHSIAAKSLAYRIEPGASFIRLLQHYSTPFLGHLTFGNTWIAVGFILYPFLYLTGSLYLLRQSRRWWPYLAYPYLYLAVFALANPLIFRWYLTPPLPGYFLGILGGLEALFKPRSGPSDLTISQPRLRRLPVSRPLRSALSLLLIIVAPCLLTLRGWVWQPDHGPHTPAPDMAWFKLELLYRQAADLLAPEIAARPGPVWLAAGDVGVLGFYTTAQILDTVGLNSPLATRYYPLDAQYYAGNYAIPPALILDQQPDYLVFLEVYGRNGLLKERRFWENYRLREKIPTDIYGSDGMLIFERQP